MKLEELLREYGEEQLRMPELGMPASIDAAIHGKRKPGLYAWPWNIAIAAALFLVVAGISAWRQLPKELPAIAKAITTRPLENEPATETPPMPVAAPTRSRRVSRPIRPATAPKAADTKTFMTILEASYLPTPQSMQVVRVELPAERLVQLGLVTSAPARRVQAEVLVGDDGIARAVRVLGE